VTAIWIVMALLFRISSLSALTAMLLAPVLFWRLQPEMAFVYVTVIITVMLFWRHRSNIRDLLSGQEGRIGQGSNREQQ
jgi:glycerol-3-phosphate acyltransferase PlsY